MKDLSVHLGKILQSRTIYGAGIGEEVILAQEKTPLVFLSSDFSQAGKIKRGLESLGKTGTIISSSRESNASDDKNLLPFVEGVSSYLSGQLDFLIFLPCSAMIKFDISYFSQPLTLTKGQTFDISKIIEKLSKDGYYRCDMVGVNGEFAVRGDILDVFPIGSQNPVRIEFFDDLIESIHYFDVLQMKNLQQLENIVISGSLLPIGENTIFDLPGTKFLEHPKRVKDEMELLLRSYKVMSTFNVDNYVPFEKLNAKADNIFDVEGTAEGYNLQSLPSRNYLTDFLALKYDLQNYLKDNAVILFAGSEANKKRLCSFLQENNLVFHDFETEKLAENKIFVSALNFPYCFSLFASRIVAIGSDSLFRQQTSVFSRGKHSVFYLPKIGDYVVHSFHGIGKCIKLARMKIADCEKDYFVIEYKNGGILYLPSEEANSLSAYVGGEQAPKLSALGGAEFGRLKARVKNSLKQMAFSLLEVYREREKAEGFKFKRDEFLEKQFDDAFGFELTPDQAKAINDINADMESHKVMDRLICGDVGYGKTEVALRAAFKCAYNSKQVALLCPTTILSQQHYISARARLEPFGIKVEVLNRFKTQSQVRDILTRLAQGQVDVLIGTHRLLNKDVVFKDLGLLILDEEQRFGVEHKEQIKNAKRNIDVLSLSATPIPRTLNISLTGIRDISIIETPPKDRLPIQTYVVENSDQLMKDVLSREISRGGIAFVIYNRVETIDEFTSHLRKLLPQAKIGVATGQMQERQLESVIASLYDGQYNVFVSTTLIENGIDLPAANTMIVVEADRLGLSQLYQIRGRIGRSDKLSYAYLTYDKNKVLTPDAYKRLAAIKEFSSLGSGFKIALRDLEIRGAGNMFGKEQHGHIEKVGYDMFVKLLEESVDELKGESAQQQQDVKMEVALDAYISEDFVDSSEQRISLYTKISELESQQAASELVLSIQDAYGFVPDEVKNLCNIALLKNLASHFQVNRIRVNANECSVFLDKTPQIIHPSLAAALGQFGGRLAFDSLPKIVFDGGQAVKDKVKNLILMFDFAGKN